ncbi:GGDEF domain-containing protein [bacterium]|nr:GGDEF domain-containing protein [bacterium]
MRNLFSTVRLIWEMAKIQNELLATEPDGTTIRAEDCVRNSEMSYPELLKLKFAAVMRKTGNRFSSISDALIEIGRIRFFDGKGQKAKAADIAHAGYDRTQENMRKFVDENIALSKETYWLKQVIQQERNYSQMLIKLNNSTQNLFTITDRKLLLKTTTLSLCEDLGFHSAVLWVHDKPQNKLVPISWSNVTLASLDELDIQTDQRPYSDLLNHRKSYFIVDDMDGPAQVESSNLTHIHQLREVLDSEVIFLIPIVSIDNPEDMVENYQGKTITRAILMVGQQNKKRLIESKDLLQRYGYSVGLTLGHVDVYDFLHENYRNFKQQAITDGLTGLYNRRFFNEELDREMQRSIRHFLKMSLILLDVDHFKKYNDTNGHQAGDDVLKKVAAVLRESTRVCDMECRYGGEEFALILPETSKIQALNIAEKLRNQIEETYFQNQEKQPHGNLTISVGVSTFPDDSLDVTQLIQNADAGLYKAKEAGRNCVMAIGAN